MLHKEATTLLTDQVLTTIALEEIKVIILDLLPIAEEVLAIQIPAIDVVLLTIITLLTEEVLLAVVTTEAALPPEVLAHEATTLEVDLLVVIVGEEEVVNNFINQYNE